MTIVPCLELDDASPLPYLEIPQLGILESARKSLYEIPDPSEALASLQAVAAVALAPLRRFLEIVEIILMFKNCQEAVIDALLPPSPQPIIECLKGLIQAIARIASYFPPIEYIKTLLSLCNYLVQTIDEIISLFIYLDERISEYKRALVTAVTLNDIELSVNIDCISKQVNKPIGNAIDLPLYIWPVFELFMEPMLRLVKNPVLRQQMKKAVDLEEKLKTAQDELYESTDLPVLGELIDLLITMRNIVVMIYNAVAYLVGREPDLSLRPLPQLQNF